MEWILKKFVPIVRANDSEGELQDPQVTLRNECQAKECAEFYEKLETCNTRVRSKKSTTETCDLEMIDFIHCLDECVAKTIFSKLK